MNEKREYRSNVFCMLMEEPCYALQVYNALNNTNDEDVSLVQMVRFDGGLLLSMRNDAAFIVGTDINLYEHQSTYNPNMPLRCLFYYAEMMSDYVKNKNIYSRTLIKLPIPHFVVFYNGKQKRPELETMSLASAFEKTIKEPEIDLKVSVYNINSNYNMEFLARCGVLRDYMYLIDKVQEYKDDGDALEIAIPKAVDHCISEHVLEKFLRERKGEVTSNMQIDLRWERLLELEKAESREEGLEAGMGIAVRRLYAKGMSIDEIADSLEMDIEVVKKIIEE